jgi:multiple sugar transport system permease protein
MRRRRGIGEAGWGWTLLAGVISFIYFLPVLWIVLTNLYLYFVKRRVAEA